MAGFMKNMMSYVGMSDVQDDDDFVDSQAQETSFDNDHNVAPMNLHNSESQSGNGSVSRAGVGRMSRITTIHPKSYDDAQLVGRALRDGTPVVLNLTGVSESVAYRIVDFSAGVVFGVRGSIERVTPRVFLLSPSQVNIKVEDAPNGGSARDLFS
ncbi:cell division protein SepF [Gardnerella vaginalis]|uniref:Cell division protein SepF n=1 Tax=Gardnerella vaginalis TaxID=2702 RepID=A0A133NM42_GARVA|nr:cell division protein SepF [Gardnerella vaginalis]KXA17352.1 hypothetical protein HMPREF3216_01243 [Gardnerella vaginalis]MDK7192266.1 cell division protein SepF [Bifidobacterium sp. UMB1197]